MEFGSALARLRRSRGWSQEKLALRAGMSQRHISFLETGRARPGQASLVKLARALALKGWEQRALLAAIAPASSEPTPACLDQALVANIVERITPWPAYAFRRDGTLVAANAAITRLLGRAAPGEDIWRATAPGGGPNIYDLFFHPKGLVRWLVNPEEVVPEAMRRLQIEAAQDAALLPIIARMENYPSAKRWLRTNIMPPLTLVERYKIDDQLLSIISILSYLASPGELELDQLRFESFIPADVTSAAMLSQL